MHRGEEAEAQTGTTGDRGRVCASRVSERACVVCLGKGSGHTVLSSKTTPSPRQPQGSKRKVGSFPAHFPTVHTRCSDSHKTSE